MRMFMDAMGVALMDEYYEYGYRTEVTGDVWSIDFARDGVWIPSEQEIGMGVVDIYEGHEAEAILKALDDAHCDGEVIRRKVVITYGEPEVLKLKPDRSWNTE